MKRIVATILLGVMLSGMLPILAKDAVTPEQEIYNQAITLPAYKTSKTITIDGDDSEWDGVAEFPMLHKSVFGTDTGMTATTQLLYDDNNLYILVKTEDKDHYTHPEDSRYWDADALQFVLMNTVGTTYGTEGAVVYRPDKNEIYITTRGNLAEATKCINAKVQRKEDVTIYEIALDWNFHFGEVPKDMLFNTALADGDSGPVRETSIEMRPGTITGKQGMEFQKVVLLGEKQSFYAWIQGERREQTADEYPYDICVYNTSDATQHYTITSKEETYSLTVNSGEVGRLSQTTVFDGSVELDEVKATVSLKDEVQELNQTITVEANEAYFLNLVDKLKTYIKNLQKLVNQCKLKKIPTEYEEQIITIFEFYVRELGFDYEAKDFSRLLYYNGVFDELYQTAKTDMEAYLAGEKDALSAPLMADSAHSSEGHHFTAETTQGERPVFYLCAMTDYNWAYSTIPYLSGMGFNMTNPSRGATYNLGHKAIIAPYPSTWGRGTNQFLPEELQDKHSADVINDNGNHYAVLSGDFDMNDYPNISTHYGFVQWVDLEPGEVYEFGARVKADNAQFAHLSLSGQKTGPGTIGNMGGTYDWKEVKGEYTAGSNARVPVCIRSWGYGTFMADDVYVRNKRTGENLLINADFQHDIVVQGKRSGQWFAVNPDFLDDMEKQLQECEDRNLAVNLMLGTASLYELWPLDEMVNEGGTASKFANFIKFNPHHPIILDATEIWLDASFARFKNYKCLHSVALANEPEFFANLSQFYHPYWVEFLKEKYTTIEALNKKLNKTYKTFEEIKMPTDVSGDMLFVEYTDFNNRILIDYWRRMVEVIKKNVPDLKITIKTLHFALDEMVRGAASSNDYEAWAAEILDYNGNDGLAYRLENVNELLRTEFWFDYQASVKTAPVMDMEDHILYDSNVIDYDPKMPAWVETSVWQNPIHYVGVYTPWVWDKEHYSRFKNTQYPYRPDCIWRMGRATMDANRLAYEIVALQEETPKVAVLYNQYSMNHNQYEMNGIFNAYKAAIYRGQKVGFIVNSQLEELKDYDYLVMGVGSYMPDETFEAIYEFVKRGGRLLIYAPQNDAGHDPLMGDPYHEPFDKEKVDFILSKADIIPVEKTTKSMLTDESHLTIKEKVQATISEFGWDTVKIIDVATGQPAEDLEFTWTRYGDGYIINMANLAWDEPKNLKVEINGEIMGNMTELRRMTYEGSTIELDPYSPELIQVPLSGGFQDIDGHWAEEEIVRAFEKNIVKGKNASVFEPESTITKAEYLAMILRSAGIETEQKETDANWYDSIVRYGMENGILTEDFQPDAPILREEMAYIAVKTLKLKKTENELSELIDMELAEEQFQDTIRIAYAKGIITGFEDGTFRPKDTTTRAEAVIMALRTEKNKEGNL